MKRIWPVLLAALTLLSSARAAEPPVQESGSDLLLVNPWNPLPEGFSPELVRLPGGWQVDIRAADPLTQMLEDCRAAGLKPEICSAYRTEEQQTYLHENKIARLRAAGWDWDDAPREAARWVAAPNTSEHQTGLALDLISAGYRGLTDRQAETEEQQWLMENCWEYGFILRYPADRCDVTGVGWEPWHYRYVGTEAALAMRESGQCLEEYLESAPQGETPAEAPAETSEETPEETDPILEEGMPEGSRLPQEVLQGVRSLEQYLEEYLRFLREQQYRI